MDFITRISTTFFFIGYFPFAPGSVATAAAIALCVFLAPYPAAYVAVWVFVTALGFWTGGRMEKLCDDCDPGCVVIDEVSGVMIALFMLPLTWPVLITVFFLFRAFDMFKIYPGNILEAKKGGFGIMMDDISAGIYTNIVMQIALRLA